MTITGLSLPEIVATETLRDASPAEVKGSAAVQPAVLPAGASGIVPLPSATPALASTGSGVLPGAATAIEIPLGPQTTAVLMLKFAGNKLTLPAGFDQQSYYNQIFNGPAIPNIASFMNEVSYGQTSVKTDVYGPISVPGSFNCDTSDGLVNAAIPAAIAAGLDVSKYNHFAFVFPVAGCVYGGLGSGAPLSATATIPHQYTNIWFPIDVSPSSQSQYNALRCTRPLTNDDVSCDPHVLTGTDASQPRCWCYPESVHFGAAMVHRMMSDVTASSAVIRAETLLCGEETGIVA